MNRPDILRCSHPVLKCAAAGGVESQLFGGDEVREWFAMQAAGRALAGAVADDFREIGGIPAQGRILVLAGKGHNGGDALLAAMNLLGRFPEMIVEVLLVFGPRTLRPLAARSLQALVHAAPGRVRTLPGLRAGAAYDLLLDGVFGFQFRPPVDSRVAALFAQVSAMPIRLRAAVDLPSGLGDQAALRADFTYATGSVKAPVVDPANSPAAGRPRYLDLGFFADSADVNGTDRVLTTGVLAPLRSLRDPAGDKRTHGHLMIVGGSRSYPGAVLMAVLAALRSGVGLVTAFVPESLVPAFAARAPEAMWVGWPETPDGSLALEGAHLLRARWERTTALAIGPGLGREAETLALAKDIVATAKVPLVIDADALQPEIVTAGQAPRILTPHAGEWQRIAQAVPADAVVIRKGPLTKVTQAGATYFSPFGGPVLSRGGSGDLLAGLAGGLLAQTPSDPLIAACRATVWHGRAADLLAQEHGQVAVSVTHLLDQLSTALRG
jgi:hydroxyethylthiazole kinase-like uncharacterized protein yjeF